MPTETIYNLLVDSSGKLWLGTDKGLFFYDGIKFHSVHNENAYQWDISYLKNPTKNEIYAMNFLNQIFLLQNDSLKLLPIPENVSINFNFIDYEVQDSFLFILSNHALFILNKNSGKLLNTIRSSTYFYDIFLWNQTIYLSNEKWIYEFQNQNLLRTYPNPVSSNSQFFEYNKELYLFHKNYNDRTVFKYQNQQWSLLSVLPIPKNEYIHGYFPTSECIWISTNKKLYQYDAIQNQILKTCHWKNVTQVSHNGRWFSTLEDGLWYFPNYKILKDSQHFNNYYYIPFQNHSFNQFLIFDNISQSTQLNGFKNSLLDNEVYNFLKFNHKKRGLSGIKSLVFFEDKLLVCSSYLTYWLELKPGSHDWLKLLKRDTIYSNMHQKSTFVLRNKRSFSASMGKNHYWIAYADGLYEYDFHHQAKKVLFQDRAIIAMNLLTDKNNFLWAGTIHQGILKIQNGKAIKQYIDNRFFNDYQNLQLFEYKQNIYFVNDRVLGWINTLNDSIHFWKISKELDLKDFRYFYIENDTLKLIDRLNQKLCFKIEEKMHKNKENIGYQYFLQIDENQVYFKVNTFQYPQNLWLKIYYKTSSQKNNHWHKVENHELILQNYVFPPGEQFVEFYIQNSLTGYNTQVKKISFRIESLWWQKSWVIFIIVLMLAFILHNFIQWRIKKQADKQKLKEELLNQQLKAIKSQMNPHFIYNILNSIQGMLYENEKLRASEMLGYFSDFIRNVLETSEKNTISVKDEMVILENYLNLEKMRFENKEFSFKIECSHLVQAQEFKIPSMIVQPFVENAIKHGLIHKNGEKFLYIHFDLVESELQIQVEDNGIGREQAQWIQKRKSYKSTQFSTRAIQNRIDLLNKLNLYDIQLDIKDKINSENQPNGTAVLIKIKHKNYEL